MPTTLISIRKARPPQQRRALLEAVHAALVEGIQVPEHDRDVRLQVFAAADWLDGPKLGEDYTLVEISLFPGRGLEAKRALYQALVRRLSAFGIAPAQLRVILHEVPPENWGLRGGIPGSELAAEPKVNVEEVSKA